MGVRSKRWLKVLKGISAMQQEVWSREAVARLTDRELRLLRDALQEPNHVFEPEEQAAMERYNGFYEEARRGV